MDDSIALDKKKQSKVSKKFAKLKSNVNTLTSKHEKPKRGVVYVGHIPHGFFEKEMSAYFKQFGKVSHVRLCRSEKTGQSKGYGFVEFQNAEVAKVAAKTMDNYLMCNRRLIAKYVTPKKNSKQVFMKSASKKNYPVLQRRKEVNKIRNSDVSEADHILKCTKIAVRVRKTLLRLKNLGIEYNFKAADDEYDLNRYFDENTFHKKEKIEADVKEDVKQEEDSDIEEDNEVEVKADSVTVKKTTQKPKKLNKRSLISKRNIKKLKNK